MNFRNLLISASLIATAPVFAATYYVTPKGAGEKTGVDEANAFGIEELITFAANQGDDNNVFNFAAGVYKPTKVLKFKSGTGATLNGSTEGRTIFSGDKNDDGVANSGDLNKLICLAANTTLNEGNIAPKTRPVIVNNIDFTCVNINNATVSGDNIPTALLIDNTGKAEINNCKFYNNASVGKYGGAALYLHRTACVITGCEFSDNTAKSRGGAVRITGDTKADRTDRANTTFKNCVFKNNSSDFYGGAIHVTQSRQLTIEGCTFYDNTCGNKGAAISFDIEDQEGETDSNIEITNTTIAQKIANSSEDEGATDTQIYAAGKANIALTNSIVVPASAEAYAIYYENTTATKPFTSGGYNVVGSCLNTAAVESDTRASIITTEAPMAGFDWQATDHAGSDYTYSYVFGENSLNADNQLLPVVYIEGQDNKLPGAVNLTQSELIATGVEEIVTEGEVGGLTVVGASVYRLAGATCIEVYSISGAQMAVVAGDTIDLNGLNGGIYILRAGNKSCKVIK